MEEGTGNANPSASSTSKSKCIMQTEVYKQLHETSRHGFGLYIHWFTFFITVNFVALGWLSRANNGHPDTLFLTLIPLAFIFFIFLGVKSASTEITYTRSVRDELSKLMKEQGATVINPEAVYPYKLYIKNIWLTILALIGLLIVWFVILVHTFQH